jgi:hypothetical protein
MNDADNQNGKYRGIYKSALTQKLFIVPQANVLSGAGQVQTTSTGQEDFTAEKNAEEKGAAGIISRAAKQAALDKKKEAAKAAKSHAQKLDAAPYMRPMPAPFNKEAAPLQTGHPQPFGGEARPYSRPMSVPFGKEVRPMGAKQVTSSNEEYGQSGMTLSQVLVCAWCLLCACRNSNCSGDALTEA